ncbi:hypothetical protein [Sphingomicrobium sediminis]|uniref:Uncharacterized protein n=1 Tax=Sphingomicrobium sediminis TaxID=2950949 RepID=A0A9X2EF09_9SPHN|nr:hypothetical protein [Sphingomicrobium sediminis]MCM8556327.1 hypothetical protein [Sphingomicrobium sediminis]
MWALIAMLALQEVPSDLIDAALTAPPPPPDFTSYDVAPPRCDDGEASEEQRAALAAYDFLIGDYAVTGHIWQGSGWSPPRPGAQPSRWNGYYGLGGTAIFDEWFTTDPGTDPDTNRGINIRMVKPDGDWAMSWIASPGYGVQSLTASEGEDGWLRMVQEYPERPGFEAVFVRINDNRWGRIHMQPNPNGEGVTPILLVATRLPCAST